MPSSVSARPRARRTVVRDQADIERARNGDSLYEYIATLYKYDDTIVNQPKKNTIVAKVTTLNALARVLRRPELVESPFDFTYLAENPLVAHEALMRAYDNDRSLASNTNNLVKILRLVGADAAADQVAPLMVQQANAIEDEYAQGNVTERFQDAFVPFELLYQHAQRLLEDFQRRSREGGFPDALTGNDKRFINSVLIANLNTQLPPMRSEIANMRVLRQATADPEPQWDAVRKRFTLQGAPLAFNVLYIYENGAMAAYVTASKSGERTSGAGLDDIRIEYPRDLAALVNASLRVWERGYLLSNPEPKTMQASEPDQPLAKTEKNNQNYYNALAAAFRGADPLDANMRMQIDNLRRIYANFTLTRIDSGATAAHTRIALMMRHSFMTHQSKYIARESQLERMSRDYYTALEDRGFASEVPELQSLRAQIRIPVDDPQAGRTFVPPPDAQPTPSASNPAKRRRREPPAPPRGDAEFPVPAPDPPMDLGARPIGPDRKKKSAYRTHGQEPRPSSAAQPRQYHRYWVAKNPAKRRQQNAESYARWKARGKNVERNARRREDRAREREALLGVPIQEPQEPEDEEQMEQDDPDM